MISGVQSDMQSQIRVNARLESQVSQLNEEVKNQAFEMKNCKSEVKELKNILVQKDEVIKELEEKVSKLSNEVFQLKEKNEKKDEVIKKLEEKVSKLSNEVFQQNEKIKKLEAEKKEEEKRSTELNASLDKKTEESKKVENDLKNEVKKVKDANVKLINDLYDEVQRSQRTQSRISKATEISLVAAPSVCTAASLGTVAGGAVVTPFCPPLGILVMGLGLVGAAGCGILTGIRGRRMHKINQVRKRHKDLTFNQATQIVSNGSVIVRNRQNQKIKYTRTTMQFVK
jgi:myosin heavy subunit